MSAIPLDDTIRLGDMTIIGVNTTLIKQNTSMTSLGTRVNIIEAYPANYMMNIYNNGEAVSNPKIDFIDAIVVDGIASFNLADSHGVPIFRNILGIPFATCSETSQNLMIGNFEISEDKKNINATVNKAGNVLLGIIQVVSAANGVAIRLMVVGN